MALQRDKASGRTADWSAIETERQLVSSSVEQMELMTGDTLG